MGIHLPSATTPLTEASPSRVVSSRRVKCWYQAEVGIGPDPGSVSAVVLDLRLRLSSPSLHDGNGGMCRDSQSGERKNVLSSQ